MILSRLLKWTHASICTCETRCISAEIRLGNFHGSTGMGIIVTRLLIRAYSAEFDKVVEVLGGTGKPRPGGNQVHIIFVDSCQSACFVSRIDSV
ncbi:hypothetical protein N7527_001396 [Penicillium freii]|uniref:Uncharacterized protein n=1 Tax=Penicillium freii TaxID=48697 RepID=A0A101MRB2_PENFR|nr:hypothetical protein N7527_001396 [Penicillium freii]KUM65275.1 hypothetical protein ACN42_g1791 [Penicillium freii]